MDVKFWPEIKNISKYAGKKAFIGSVTDPYQPLEEKYGRTRKLLKELRGSGISVDVATKSDLVVRDLDLIKSFPNARVLWSVNTLDEAFRGEMDTAASIERRLAAMKIFHDAGVRTTCFVSPIFPGITDLRSIVLRAEDRCNLIWLENLNLRGDYRARILAWIHKNHPELDGLYQEIYVKKNRDYWNRLDAEMREFTRERGLPYVRNDDSMKRPFEVPPVVVNYFFHEEIVSSAGKRLKE